MPIIITWDSGERQAFIGPDPAKALEFRFIPVKRVDNGHDEYLVKDKIRSIEHFPDEDWNRMVEEQKKKHEEQEAERKRQAEAEAKRKADEQAAAKPKPSRLKRLFGRKV